jgi:hypothetical protein
MGSTWPSELPPGSAHKQQLLLDLRNVPSNLKQSNKKGMLKNFSYSGGGTGV